MRGDRIAAAWVLLAAAGAAAARDGGTVLIWQEQEPGIAAYTSRMLITEDYVRSDEGRDDDDFILFDRKARRIFSVTHASSSVLEIAADPIPRDAAPRPVVEVTLTAAPDAPKIAGRALTHYRLAAGGTTCLDATLAPGLLPEATDALREMQQILAARQYRDLGKTPEEYRTPCMLANYVYEAGRHLRTGFPIQESRESGQQRLLMDYQTDQTLSAELFRLPDGYRRQPLR